MGLQPSLKSSTLITCITAIALLLVRPVGAQETEIVLSVPGIPGPYCAYGVEKRLLELDGVQRVELLWKEQRIRAVIAEGKIVTLEQIRMAVKKADYPYDYEIVKP